jgi:PIN domain nuclease of toxin-antitoxin system
MHAEQVVEHEIHPLLQAVRIACELPLTGAHAVSIDRLPNHHKDPFDRMLIAQAEAEGFVLLTADKELEAYGGPVRVV